ncbi:Cell division control protein 7 [Linderina pennispora]|nr:Cell division control protein 7 [Linderina pennispora]
MLPTKRQFRSVTYTRESEIHQLSYSIPEGLPHEELFTPEGIPIVQPVAKRPRLVFEFAGGLTHQDPSGGSTPGKEILALHPCLMAKAVGIDGWAPFLDDSVVRNVTVDNDHLKHLLETQCAENITEQAAAQVPNTPVIEQPESAEDILVQTSDAEEPADHTAGELSLEGCEETDNPEVELPEISATIGEESDLDGPEQPVELNERYSRSGCRGTELSEANGLGFEYFGLQETEQPQKQRQQETEQDRTHDTPIYNGSGHEYIYTDTGGDTQEADDSRCSEAPEQVDGKEEEEEDGAAEEEEDGAAEEGEDGRDENEDGDDNISEEIEELKSLIPGLSDQYKLLGKIGEGTFSTVYKAIDLQHDRYDNHSWEMIYDDAATDDEASSRFRRPGRRRRSHMVAIKKIYVTSSPARIANEIAILNDLRGSRFVAPLVTAMRKDDQVIIVLPYFPNDDFRSFYMTLSIDEIRWYMASLFEALKFSHRQGIMHRDIKPSNFLYDIGRRHGVLVDFGLAERENDQEATKHRSRHALQMDSTTAARIFRSFDMRGRPGIPRKDTRPGLRANRAGTRGFRAPEVLLKIAKQSVAIDIWSAGVILLCFLTRRFPFFQSTDDTEALLEIAVLYGRLEMERAAVALGRTFLTNIPTVKDRGIRFESLIKAYNLDGFLVMPPEAYDLLRRLLALTPDKRITAAEALEHPFITNRPFD